MPQGLNAGNPGASEMHADMLCVVTKALCHLVSLVFKPHQISKYSCAVFVGKQIVNAGFWSGKNGFQYLMLSADNCYVYYSHFHYSAKFPPFRYSPDSLQRAFHKRHVCSMGFSFLFSEELFGHTHLSGTWCCGMILGLARLAS